MYNCSSEIPTLLWSPLPYIHINFDPLKESSDIFEEWLHLSSYGNRIYWYISDQIWYQYLFPNILIWPGRSYKYMISYQILVPMSQVVITSVNIKGWIKINLQTIIGVKKYQVSMDKFIYKYFKYVPTLLKYNNNIFLLTTIEVILILIF